MNAQIDEEQIVELASKTSTIDKEGFSFYEENFKELQEEYGGKIVAIFDHRVVEYVDRDVDKRRMGEFIEEVRNEYGSNAFITHIPEPDHKLLL